MTDSATPVTPEAELLLRRIERAFGEVYALAKGPNRPGGRRFRMSIPVDPEDSDMVLIAGLQAGEDVLRAATSKQARAAYRMSKP